MDSLEREIIATLYPQRHESQLGYFEEERVKSLADLFRSKLREVETAIVKEIPGDQEFLTRLHKVISHYTQGGTDGK